MRFIFLIYSKICDETCHFIRIYKHCITYSACHKHVNIEKYYRKI